MNRPDVAQEEEEAWNALAYYIRAAAYLRDCWHPCLDAGYPEGLPSFDEHVASLQAWVESE